MSDTITPGTFVQWHNGHGTGVVYTAVVVDTGQVDARPANDTTPVRILAVDSHREHTPALPVFGGRPVHPESLDTTRHAPTSRLRPLTLATVAHSVWESAGAELTGPLSDTVAYATYAAAAVAATVALPDAVFADVHAPLTPEQAAAVFAWMAN